MLQEAHIGVAMKNAKEEVKACADYVTQRTNNEAGIAEVIEKAKAEREKGIIVAINIMKKNKKFQKEQLMADGYEEIEMIYAD